MKKDDTNLGAEFIYKLSLKKSFQIDIAFWQAKLPKKPKYKVLIRAWELRMQQITDKAMNDLIRKYRIPFAYLPNLGRYFLFGRFSASQEIEKDKQGFEPTSDVAVVNEIDPRLGEPIEALYQTIKEPYVSILILDNASKLRVHKFIDNNWDKIENLLSKQRGFKRGQRIKPTLYKERNSRIRELLGKDKPELFSILGPKATGAKISLIRQVLKKEGFGDVSDGYIRKLSKKT